MSRRKKVHFAEMKEMSNVFEYPENMKGKWRKHFGNDNPVWLEVGCGRGEYTIGLARLYPDVNVIGIDVKGSRMWHGAKIAEKEGLGNVAFLRIKLEQILDFFSVDEVNRIWITFPDPQPRVGKENKRLTSKRFLDFYEQVCVTGSFVNLKTDNSDLFNYSIDEFKAHVNYELEQTTHDLYSQTRELQELDLKTYYELRFLSDGLKIKYLRSKLI